MNFNIIRVSQSFDSGMTMTRRKSSLKTESLPEEESACYKSAVPNNRSTPKKKPDYGTHVVSKSELWDTGSQHRCMKSHQKSSRVSISQEEGRNFNYFSFPFFVYYKLSITLYLLLCLNYCISFRRFSYTSHSFRTQSPFFSARQARQIAR